MFEEVKDLTGEMLVYFAGFEFVVVFGDGWASYVVGFVGGVGSVGKSDSPLLSFHMDGPVHPRATSGRKRLLLGGYNGR